MKPLALAAALILNLASCNAAHAYIADPTTVAEPDAIINTRTLTAAQHNEVRHFNRLDWNLKADKHGIRVLTAPVPNSSYNAYQATTTIAASTDALVAIIRNPETCIEWVYRCDDSYRFGSEGPDVDLIYTSSNMPFPVKDRDTLARIQWQENPTTAVVTAVGTATRDVMGPEKSHVRIEEATVIWKLTPLPNGQTLVKTFGHADPGGELPAWLINQLSTEVPLKTLTGLRTLAAEDIANTTLPADRRLTRN